MCGGIRKRLGALAGGPCIVVEQRHDGRIHVHRVCRELEALGRTVTRGLVPGVLSQLDASYPSACAALEAKAGKGH